MPAIVFLRRNALEAVWLAFAATNFAVMVALPRWETIPFHLIWVSLTLLYGLKVFSPRHTGALLALVFVATGAGILHDTVVGTQPWDEVSEVPLMSAMFLAMVWHARRRHDAIATMERQAAERESLLERQERFLHDASHELRTPVTIARGQLELSQRTNGARNHELDIALDELGRMERILDRLLLLAKADQPDFVITGRIDVESFLEDVFMRWSETANRTWRLGRSARGVLHADPEGLRTVLDALLENAVKYSDERSLIELRSTARGSNLVIEVRDRGRGIEPAAHAHIFDRFARADAARTRAQGGVGLGLAIVDAIVKAHGGHCTVQSSPRGSTFAVIFPRFRTLAAHREPAAAPFAADPASA